MSKKLEDIIIPKEEAVFFLDKDGRWHHKEQGEFLNEKIIDYFHECIRKDEMGYHLEQVYDGKREKVYFHHEDTALFVFSIKKGKDLTLVLNTKKEVKLKPKDLYIKDDYLYVKLGDEAAKFLSQSIVQISKHLEFDDNAYIKLNKKKYKIPEF